MDNRIYISGREYIVDYKVLQAIKRYKEQKLGDTMQMSGSWGKVIDMKALTFEDLNPNKMLDWATLDIPETQKTVTTTTPTPVKADIQKPLIKFYDSPEQLKFDKDREKRVEERQIYIKNLELNKHLAKLKSHLEFLKVPEATSKDINQFPTFRSHTENYVKHDVVEYIIKIPLPDTGATEDLSRYFTLERVKVYCPTCRKSTKDELRLYYTRELTCIVRNL